MSTATIDASTDTDAAEQRRLAQRAAVRRRVAEAQLADSRHVELVESIARMRHELDTLGLTHAADARELQTELAAVEQRAIDRIVRREPSDAADEARRSELLNQLVTKNADLKASVEQKQRVIDQLEGERIKVASCCTTSMLESDLYRCGRPDLVASHKAAFSAMLWADKRVQMLRDRIEQKPASDYLQRQLADAQQEVATAKARADAAYRAVIDETEPGS